MRAAAFLVAMRLAGGFASALPASDPFGELPTGDRQAHPSITIEGDAGFASPLSGSS